MMCRGLPQEYSHDHVVMVVMDLLKILRRMRLRVLIVMIIHGDMTMHVKMVLMKR